MDAVEIDAATEVAHGEDEIEATVPELCRVCLLGHMIMRDLFVENDVLSLSTKAMSFASVKMLPEDGLPGHVCCDCADKLEAAYEFKLQVEQADNVLRQRYDTLNIKEELFFNEVEVHLEGDRGDDVHTLDVDAHYQATVDSLNADSVKPTMLKDHLALLEVEKIAKAERALANARNAETEGIDVGSDVGSILQEDEDHHYLQETDDHVEELGDCGQDYRESAKADELQVPEGIVEGITVEEHNYIMQQQQQQQEYNLPRQIEAEEMVNENVATSSADDSVNYLSLMNEEIAMKNMEQTEEILKTDDAEVIVAQEESIGMPEKRRSKRKLCKRARSSDEETYFENLNLTSRESKTELEKSDKFYFLCYLCDREFLTKDSLKEHMQCHDEIKQTLLLSSREKETAERIVEDREPEKASSSSTKTPTISSNLPPVSTLSRKKSNKCPYCGKEYLYVIPFNKHIKKHERNQEIPKDSSGSQENSMQIDEAYSSSDLTGHEESGTFEARTRVQGSEEDDNKADASPSSKKRRRKSSRNENSFACDKCPAKFSQKNDLLEHSNEHYEVYKCSTCDRDFEDLEKLRRHRTEHVVEGVLSEQEIGENTYEREQYEAENDVYEGDDMTDNQNNETIVEESEDNNAESFDDDNRWKLELETDENVDSMNDETKAIIETSGNWSKNHKCQTCGINCSSKKSLSRHMLGHSQETAREICKLCRVSFYSRESLQRHVEQQHNGSRQKITYKCTDCDKIFPNELTLRNHLVETNHKTTIQGQQYDTNKRLKRLAAKAAQLIIDKIKDENNLEDDYEDQEIEENAHEGLRDEVDEDDDPGDEETEEKIKFDPDKPEIKWETTEERIHESTPKKTPHRSGSGGNRRGAYECKYCRHWYVSKHILAQHVEQNHVGIDIKHASMEKSLMHRKNSMMTMTRDERFEDSTDNEDNSDFESGLDWPIDNHECPTCKKKYSTKKSLLRHQLLHEEPHFECDICNVKFYRKDKLKSHYDKCSEKNPDQVRKCNICGDTFENNEILRVHRDGHVNEGILTAEDLRDIEPGTNRRKKSPKIPRKRRLDIVGLECTECNKRYTSRKGLLRHIQVHEGKKYLCDICPKKFYRREHLKIHVAKHNMIKPYKCPRCTKRFIKEEQLSNHVSKHDRTFKKPKETDMPKRFLCEICSKSFTQSTTLIAHLRAHNGIKPYVCDVCARPFTTNAYLKMHMRTHTQERPYSCKYCARAFARADTLANHLTSHTGEAKYHCKFCPKNFRRLKSLKEHVFIHTGQRPYACPTCDRRFNNNGSRYAHSKRCKQNLLQNPNTVEDEPLSPTLAADIANTTTTATATTLATISDAMAGSHMLQNTIGQPIRIHSISSTHELTESQLQLIKAPGIKTIAITRTGDHLTGHQIMQHQEILMPLILPLTVTLADVEDEVILPEGTKIYTTA